MTLENTNDEVELGLKQLVAAAAARYKPQVLAPELWQLVREDAVDLVLRTKPSFEKEFSMVAGSLCRLIAAYAGEVDEVSIAVLLTTTNVDRLLKRFHAEGMNVGTLGQHQVRLRRLLNEHLGLPKNEPAPARPKRHLVPYDTHELDAMVEFYAGGPTSVRQAGLDALCLALGFGIVTPETEEVQVAGSQVSHRGRPLEIPASFGNPLLDEHAMELGPVSKQDWDGLRRWTLWQGPELDLTAQRLRDTWLVARVTHGTVPLVVLMSQDNVGRERLLLAASHAKGASTQMDALRQF